MVYNIRESNQTSIHCCSVKFNHMRIQNAMNRQKNVLTEFIDTAIHNFTKLSKEFSLYSQSHTPGTS